MGVSLPCELCPGRPVALVEDDYVEVRLVGFHGGERAGGARSHNEDVRLRTVLYLFVLHYCPSLDQGWC